MPKTFRQKAAKRQAVAARSGVVGRVLDGSGKPLDGLPFPDTTETGALITPPFNPLQRTPIEHVLDTGVRPINALLTVGRGQRMGRFAGRALVKVCCWG